MRKRATRKRGKTAKGHLHMDDATSKLRYAAPPPTTADSDDMQPKSYRLALKRLRNRANITAKEAAKAVNKGESGYMRYEDDKRFDHEPIPASIIMGLLPLLTGRGDPPIKQDELLAISELANIHQVLTGGAFKPVTAAIAEAADFAPSLTLMPIRYQIEEGTYRDSGRVRAGSYGMAPILPLRSYPHNKQWAAVLYDDSGERLGFPKGTILHCVDVSVLPPEARPPGSMVVVLVSKGELAEVAVAIVTNSGRGGRVKVDGVEREDVEVLGVAVYRYGPVGSQPV